MNERAEAGALRPPAVVTTVCLLSCAAGGRCRTKTHTYPQVVPVHCV